MEWEFGFSRQAEKFLSRQHLPHDFATEAVTRAVRKMLGETVAVDLKRLTGSWEGHYRVRIRKVRVIFSIDFIEHRIHIEVIDFRGGAYR